MDPTRSARRVSVTAWLTTSPRLGHAPNRTNGYPRADVGGNNSARPMRDAMQPQGSPATQGSSGCRDRTLDDGEHLAAELLLGLP